jgi:lambda family phage minor tail protein L
MTIAQQTAQVLGPLIPTGRDQPPLSPYNNEGNAPGIIEAQLSTGLALHINALDQSSPFAWLFEVEIPTSPPTRLRFTNQTKKIAWGADSQGNPIEYDPYPVKVGKIAATKGGDLPTIKVQVSNVTREVGRLIDTYDGLTGQLVVLRIINLATLLDPSAEVRIDSQIRSVAVNNKGATFVLSPYNLQQDQIPSRRYLKNHCDFHFGRERCGYVLGGPSYVPDNTVGGGFNFCPKTFEGCVERGDDEEARLSAAERLHPDRAGFFRGIPRLSRKVGILG